MCIRDRFYPVSWVIDDSASVDVALDDTATLTTCGIDSEIIPNSSLSEGVVALSGALFTENPETSFFDLNGAPVARLTGAGLFSVPTVLQIAYETDSDLAHTVICFGGIEDPDVQLILDSMVLLSLDS